MMSRIVSSCTGCIKYVYLFSVFLVFFFFKQKTAYEMRISDWSSDVCSSDLALGLALTAFGGPQAHAANNDGSVAGHTQAGAVVVVANPATEIGRASCRERVCQYV